MKNAENSVCSNLAHRVAVVVLGTLILFPTTHAGPIEEITSWGKRTVYGFGNRNDYIHFLDSATAQWISQLNAAISAAVADNANMCQAHQATFRSTCLDLAHNAAMGCIAAGGSLTGFLTWFGLVPGAATGISTGMTCYQANYNATNACNAAANGFTYPDAPPICQFMGN